MYVVKRLCRCYCTKTHKIPKTSYLNMKVKEGLTQLHSREIAGLHSFH